MTIDEARVRIPDFDTFCEEYCNACLNNVFCAYCCNTIDKAERIFDRVLQAYARYDGDLVKVERYIKMQKSENMDKKDLSQNCDFDDDSGKNDCWHCEHFLFPIGCMYGEDGEPEC